MASSFMPSAAHVAEALYTFNTDLKWSEAPDDDRDSYMLLARTAINAIVQWQAQAHSNGERGRYFFEMAKDDVGDMVGWAIYDRIKGFNQRIATLQDALLAQQVVDDLNKRENQKAKPAPVTEPATDDQTA